MRQAALQMIRNPHRYYPYIEWELIQTGESYESYCTNLFRGNIWGDDLIAGVIGDMWNLAVSVISPIYTKPVKLWHDKSTPDIVIIANGGAWMSEVRPCTHFSSSRWKDETREQAGAELLEDRHNPTVAQDDVPHLLRPILLSDTSKAKAIALREYRNTDEERSLKLLRGTCVQIKNLEEEIVKKIGETETLRDQKKVIEYKLEKLGVITEKIEEYGRLEDPEYCRLSERKKKDEENERKRKRQEEEEENERKRRREEEEEREGNKKHGEVVLSIPEPDKEFEERRYQQQKTIISDQEIIIQQQTLEVQKLNVELEKL